MTYICMDSKALVCVNYVPRKYFRVEEIPTTRETLLCSLAVLWPFRNFKESLQRWRLYRVYAI